MIIHVEEKKRGFTISISGKDSEDQFLQHYSDIRNKVQHLNSIPFTIQVRNPKQFETKGLYKDEYYEIPFELFVELFEFKPFKDDISLLYLCSGKLLKDFNFFDYMITGIEKIKLYHWWLEITLQNRTTFEDVYKELDTNPYVNKKDIGLILSYWKNINNQAVND